MRTPRPFGLRGVVRSLLPAVLLSAVLFWVAYDGGSYSLQSRASLAVALWWVVIVGVALRLVSANSVPRETLLVGGILALLVAWTLASSFWASSAEDSFDDFNRVSLYLASYAVVVAASSRATLSRWLDAVTVAIVAVAVVSLVSRLFPGSFPGRGLPTFLPAAVTRLSFPLDYWNGLAVFVAFAVPLLLAKASSGRSPVWRGLALAPMPVLASVIYLTSSRGGLLTAGIGGLAFLILAEQRWRATAAILASVAGMTAAVGVLSARHDLVNGPLGTDAVRRQGLTAALLVAGTCVATAVAYGYGSRLLGGRLRPGSTTARLVVFAIVAAAAIAVVAAHPVRRFESFKALPTVEQSAPGDIRAHLLSGGGSGRWQFWTAAVQEWKRHPVAGGGAGSYEQWWTQHASFAYTVRDAHSLYLQALGELGLVGLALTVALVAFGTWAGARRAWRASGEARAVAAASTAVFVSFAVAAGIDWMWELPAVTVFALVALGIATGPATTPPGLRVANRDERALRRRGFGLAIAMLAVAWVLLLAQAVSLLSQRALAESESAVRNGDLRKAFNSASDARDIEPWAATPYLQLALVSERRGDLAGARTWVRRAIHRDELDWRLWLVRARIETKLGQGAAAVSSLRRAASLNPRSPLFTSLHLPRS